jgi:hypothetical protein
MSTSARRWCPETSGVALLGDDGLSRTNQGVWNATRGDNMLAEITLSESAPGTADPGATSFAVIP